MEDGYLGEYRADGNMEHTNVFGDSRRTRWRGLRQKDMEKQNRRQRRARLGTPIVMYCNVVDNMLILCVRVYFDIQSCDTQYQ